MMEFVAVLIAFPLVDPTNEANSGESRRGWVCPVTANGRGEVVKEGVLLEGLVELAVVVRSSSIL